MSEPSAPAAPVVSETLFVSVDKRNEPRSCDIVMKGGITSGVVYPLAIVQLSRRFSFRNIGGTSAGAIAAAATAAAEYRRQQSGSLAGFDTLAKLPDLLVQQAPDSQHTRLFDFFQPSPATKRLFDVITCGMDGRSVPDVVAFALKQYAGSGLLGATPGLILGTASILGGSGSLNILWLVTGLVLAGVGALLGAGYSFIREIIREVPRHGFGLCSGKSPVPYSGTDTAPAAALTVWLTGYLNETAGLPADADPLTFGQLWSAGRRDGQTGDRSVNLEMMTTCLTSRRPFRLPFRDDEDLRENALFYFREDEMLQYFPADVVSWMIKHPRTSDNVRTKTMNERLRALGFHPMPPPEQLPVVVATRMSLSFPFLLSAVPLHAIDWSLASGHRDARDHIRPERCWFSDGGMCSNFPLHFFDAALPRRPTFSIDLTEKPAGTPDTAMHPDMASSNASRISERWNRFDTLPPSSPGATPAEKSELRKLLGFIDAMVGTMQNWTDTTQARLAGYRDRIVSVPLRPDEGGLNLNMPRELITALSERGREAADLLAARFDVPPVKTKMAWDNHRWVRLRSTLAAFEKFLDQIVRALDHPENGDTGYEEWLRRIEAGEVSPSYRMMNSTQLAAAQQTLAQLRLVNNLWQNISAADGSPRPRPVLRPRPQI